MDFNTSDFFYLLVINEIFMLNIILFSMLASLYCIFPISNLTESTALAALAGTEGQYIKANEGSSMLDEAQSGEGQKKDSLSPSQMVDRLDAKSSDWQEPSKQSEERYKKAILQWLSDMQPRQRELAYKILKDAHPEMHNIRMAIRDKKRELANLSFNMHTTPEALPRLGQELQNLRKKLHSGLELISERLREEVGVSLGPLERDSFWLQPLDIENSKPKASNKGNPKRKSNSNNSQNSMFSLLGD